MPPGRLRLAAVALLAVAVTASVAVACDGGSPTSRTSDAAPSFLVEDLGGATTARALRGRPFNQSARNLDNNGLARFAAGAEPFDQRLLDPTSEGPMKPEALGRLFIDDGCLACHLDGTVRRAPSAADLPPGLLLRVSSEGSDLHGGPMPVEGYGLEIQPRATTGPPEASVDVRWEATDRALADATVVSLRRPVATVSDPANGSVDPAMLTSIRTGVPIVGLGLLEAIPEADLRAAAAQQARDGQVSGRVNEVWDDLGERLTVGRFGWKAGQESVRSQTTAALVNDMGVRPDDGEMSASVLSDLVFYNRTIAVPVARDTDDSSVRRGANTFVSVGCAACHSPVQRSGPDEVAALADQTFHPYTDLLLHDMGRGLADGRPEYLAGGSEWRTAPLWGIGRRIEVLGFANFLHDGRARTLTEAIEWHGGEAAAARRSFERLDADTRRDLLAFLGSL